MTIKKLLIANRGEIASRIIRSAHDMGIATVAIYTEPDSNSPYVRQANEAFKLAMPEIQRGVSKGLMHKNTASRKLSRLSNKIKLIK